MMLFLLFTTFLLRFSCTQLLNSWLFRTILSCTSIIFILLFLISFILFLMFLSMLVFVPISAFFLPDKALLSWINDHPERTQILLLKMHLLLVCNEHLMVFLLSELRRNLHQHFLFLKPELVLFHNLSLGFLQRRFRLFLIFFSIFESFLLFILSLLFSFIKPDLLLPFLNFFLLFLLLHEFILCTRRFSLHLGFGIFQIVLDISFFCEI